MKDKQLLMREAIALTMEKSNREIPHYYLETEISMEKTLEWLEKENSKNPPAKRILYIVPLLKALSLSLKKFPEFNGFYKEGAFQPSQAIHLGIIVSLRSGGLLAPALHDVDQKKLEELMSQLQDLIKRARTGSLRSSEVTDPTITVTNLGEEGVERVFGLIYPPQVAIIGFGKMIEKPVSKNGKIISERVISV